MIEAVQLGNDLVSVSPADPILDYISALLAGDHLEGGQDGHPPRAKLTHFSSINLDYYWHFPDRSTGDCRRLLLPDGWPPAVSLSLRTRRVVRLVPGSSLLPRILDAANELGVRVAFVGGSTEQHRRLSVLADEVWRGMPKPHFESPARRELSSSAAMQALVTRVRHAGARLVVVSLGMPHQEDWMSTWGHLTNARVVVGFGAAADFLVNLQRRAPVAVQRLKLEWLWRLAHSPRRLFARYILRSPTALYHMLAAHRAAGSIVTIYPVDRN